MNYMIRAVDGHGVVITKLYETESEFLDRLDYYRKIGLRVEAYHKVGRWEPYGDTSNT